MRRNHQLAHQFDVLHACDLARAENPHRTEIAFIARCHPSCLAQEFAVKVAGMTLFLARQGLACGVDSNEEVDDVSQVAGNLYGLQPISGDDALQALPLNIGPVNPLRLVMTWQTRLCPEAVPLLNSHEEKQRLNPLLPVYHVVDEVTALVT